MKVAELKSINIKRYTHGKGDDTLFCSVDETDGIIKWVCTHGFWELWTDKQGKYQAGTVKIDIEEVYVLDQYMGLFGDNNPYE